MLKKTDVFFLGVISVIVIYFFLPLFFPVPKIFVTPDFGQSDLWQLNFPLKFSLSEALQKNSLPLWNSKIGTGFPQLAEGQTGTFNAVNMLVFRFLPFFTAINIGYISIFLISSLSTYLYLRFLKLERSISLFGALIFALSGFFITHISHFNLIQAASFLPLAFFFTQRFVLTKKNRFLDGLILSVVLSQQYFAGFTQISFITLAGLLGLVIFLHIRKSIANRKVFGFAGAVIFCIFLSAVQFLPSFEFLKVSNRAEGFKIAEATFFSFPLSHFKTFLNPFALGDPRTGSYPSFIDFNGSVFWENTAYIGILPLIFAVLSLFALRKNKNVQYYWLLLLGSALLMLGKFSPLYFLYSIPPFSFFRVPSRFILLFVWALCILSSFGLQKFKSYLDEKKPNLKFITAVVFFLSFFQVLSFAKNYNPIKSINTESKPPQSAKILAEQKNARYLTLGTADEWNGEFLKNGWQNTDVFTYLRNDLTPNVNLLYGLESYQVYPILLSRRFQNSHLLLLENIKIASNEAVITDAGQKLLNNNSITHIISPKQIKSLPLVTSFKKDNSLPAYYIYSNPKALPYARVVYKSFKKDTLEEMNAALQKKEFDPESFALLEEKVELKEPASGAGRVSFTKENGKIVLKTHTSQKSLLVIAENYFPGWIAHIDGQETTIYPANLSQMAITVPEGTHVVKLEYRPTSFSAGLIITVLSYLIVFLTAFGSLFSFLKSNPRFSGLFHRP